MPSTSEVEAGELQSILANAAMQNKPARPRAVPDQPTKGQSLDSLLDNMQWEVLPNGTYIATGLTQPNLPPGSYTLAMTDSGKPIFNAKKILTDSLIDLGDSNSQRVLAGIRLFWTKKEQYAHYGLLYKRGVLMWGPAGSGKTATLSMLIQDLIVGGGIVVLVQNPGLAVRALPVLRRIEPERPLIMVLEDVEEIVAAHGEHDLLALLDGEHQTDNVVNLATTNYPEQLGVRIVNRPSRFDEVIKIGMPSPEMREVYLRHVLRDKTHPFDIEQCVADSDGMSIAHLKEIVVAVTCLDQEYLEVVGRLKKMSTLPKSTMYDSAVGFAASNSSPKEIRAGNGAAGRR